MICEKLNIMHFDEAAVKESVDSIIIGASDIEIRLNDSQQLGCMALQ